MRERVQAIVGGTVIDGNGGVPIVAGVLLIQDGQIVATGDSTLPVPPNAQIIPAQGRYVIPGLMDANVHLYFEHSPAELTRTDGRYEQIIRHGAKLALRNGLTTIFDTWGPRAALTQVREEINSGATIGSRIFLAGNIIGLSGPTSDEFYPCTGKVLGKIDRETVNARWEQGVGADLAWLTAEEVRPRIRHYIKESKPDFLKYASSSHAHIHLLCLSQEVQRVIVEEGHRAGLTVQAHSTSPESLRMEIEAGADLLQHPDFSGLAKIPEELLLKIADKQIPCAALFASRRFLSWAEANMPDHINAIYRIRDANDHRFVQAGAVLLLTTDSVNVLTDAAQNPLLGSAACADDNPFMVGEAHFHWLMAAQELGMKPMDMLVSATRNVAAAYRVDKELGTLERGKIADLVILDDDPLASPLNYRKIHAVMKAGRIVDRSSLAASLRVGGQSERCH